MIAEGYFLRAPSAPLRRGELALGQPGPGEALVEVKACGLCHTDVAFADGSVRTRHPLPLVLGHEVAGTVAAAGEGWEDLAGKPVLVPAVLPCGGCAFCRAGRGNACPQQKMPGNDIHGGFSTHLLVPAAPLIPLDGAPGEISLEELAVVADAVSTAYQAVRRSRLESGDLAFVVGCGGVGSFLVQIAKARGARVAATDVRASALETAGDLGADATVDAAGRSPGELRQELKALARGWGVPSLAWRIFECSGTTFGQTLAFGLLERAATLVQVGFTPEKLELRLSNLMAHDAEAHGTWGCPPEAYPEVLGLIYSGAVVLSPLVDHAPMSEINALLGDLAHHRLQRRMILHPEP